MRAIYLLLSLVMLLALVVVAVQNPISVTFAVWPPIAISLPFWALVLGVAAWGIISCGLWIAAVGSRRRRGYLSGDTVRRAIKQADMAKMAATNPLGASPFGQTAEDTGSKGKRK